MNKVFILIFLCLIVLTGCGQGLTFEQKNIKIGGTDLKVEIADTQAKRVQGLSFRESLGENEGMMFVFGKELIPTFQTRDMKFSLDIIWIRDEEVVSITENAVPTTTITFSPDQMIDTVVEVGAGFVEKNNIKINTKIEY